MISYSQLTEESYVKMALDFEYLAEETQLEKKFLRMKLRLLQLKRTKSNTLLEWKENGKKFLQTDP